MSEKQIQRCPECGVPLPEYWPRGFCPHCSLGGALGTEGNEAARSQQPEAARRFGDFELLQEIGRGGMGVIYRARQVSLDRIVALKMILAGQFASKQDVLRFRSEAEAAAKLQHANIVGIHETGERDGHHYFSMDYVQGRTLADIVRDGPLPAQRAAKYASRIAEAIHYAHTQGVLHRDLKPSNILIDAHDHPRITDFGLAKRMRDDFGVTVTGQVLGSPSFMPPEQTSSGSSQVGPPSDVYGVGAILYCLLTGRPPFHAETIEELLLLLRDADPVSPRLLNPSVPRDLETICLKCLEKEPARRYPTAHALADEIERFIRDEPIEARPLRATAKLWRWCRRRPAVALLSASVLLLLVIVAASSTVAAWRVNRARASEQRANLDLRQTVSLLELERAEDLFTARDAAAGVAHLAGILRDNPSNTIAAHRLVSALVQRGWAMPQGGPMRQASLHVNTVFFSPDARRVLTASRDKTAAVWDVSTGRVVFSLQHSDVVLSARYSPDGRRLITASADGIAQICDAETGSVQGLLRHSNKVEWAEFSPDSALALTACADRVARIWDAETGRLKRELRGHSRPVRVARFSPDGKWIATATDWGGLRLWSVESGQLIRKLAGHRESTAVETLEFSSDARRLLTSGYDQTVRLWELPSGEPIGDPLMHRLPVWHAEFSPDDKLLVTACEDGAARLWEVRTLRPLGEPLPHESGVIFARFSRDGQSVVTASSDNTARLWDVRTQMPLSQPMRQLRRVMHADFSADGRRLVTGAADGVAQIWELRPPLEPSVKIQHDRNVAPIAVTRDGSALLTGGLDRTLRLWDLRTGQSLSEPMRFPAYVRLGEFSPAGHRVALAFTDHEVWIWDFGDERSGRGDATPRVVAGPMRHETRIRAVRFSPDGTRLVTTSGRTARVWNASTGELISSTIIHRGEITSANFSPDGARVVTACDDFTAQIWDTQTGALRAAPLAHIDHVKWAEFSPDGEKVVTGSTDNTAGLWDARTGKRLLTLQHARIVEQATFSPDGLRIITACIDRTARVWDAHTGRALTPPFRHEVPVNRAQFTADGRRIFTLAWSAPQVQARLWDADTGRPLVEWIGLQDAWGVTAFDPEAGRVIMGATSGIAHVWHLPEAPVPVPAWFLDFAEALAGIRLGEGGSLERARDEEMVRVRNESSGRKASDLYEDIAFRLVTPPASRQ